ncbi:alcohol dehydrogenase catalytic domain-containing protein [Streptomyces sp. NPDC018031]|uniref:alcohol dehydrogenase catalytic domain-containing protein n=1 Tax=Streptomyces sp. NPDC018031 TaxID=3365033 RepID=UPI0037BAF336
MRALVYHGPGRFSWDTVPEPEIRDPADAIVRVEMTAICGSDLHIVRGELPEVRPGTILGHEAVGTVTEIGPEVHNTRPGEQVIVSCVSACGSCPYCLDAVYGQCRGGGGWILGREIDGTQAEYVRVPFANLSVHATRGPLTKDTAVLLAEVLPTAFEVGVRNGHVAPGDTVVVVGSGPVGLAALLTARVHSPRKVLVTDLSRARLEAAHRLGADAAVVPGELLGELAEGPGADVAIEAAGTPESFLLCTRVVRPGGHIANIGMHGRPATLHLESLWRKNVTISTGQVDTSSVPSLMAMVSYGHLDVSGLVTARMPLDHMEQAYAAFAAGPDTGELKVVLGSG